MRDDRNNRIVDLELVQPFFLDLLCPRPNGLTLGKSQRWASIEELKIRFDCGVLLTSQRANIERGEIRPDNDFSFERFGHNLRGLPGSFERRAVNAINP